MKNCNKLKDIPIETKGDCCCNCESHVAYGQYVKGRGFVRTGWACTVGMEIDKQNGLPGKTFEASEHHGYCEMHTRRND